jgi:hypothetical protein
MHRRTIFVVAAMLALPGAQSATAQVAAGLRPSVGVLAGVNVATISGSDVANASNRTGFIGGLYATFHIANGFGIEPEALYSMQGAKDSQDNLTVKLDYVQVPVLLRYDFQTKAPAHPFVMVGPSFGVKVGCKANSGSLTASCATTLLSPKSFDIGGTAGAGVAFAAGKSTLSIGARYTMGVRKTFNDSDAKNRVWSVLAGLSF